MYDRIRSRRGWLLLTLAVFFGATGWALASIPGPDGTISACYAGNGDVRIIDSAARCRARETAIGWNQQGAPGPAGRDGAPGAPGPAGASLSVLDGFEAGTVSVSAAELPPEEDFVERGGPTLTIEVPSGGALVQIMASAEIGVDEPGCLAEAAVREAPWRFNDRNLRMLIAYSEDVGNFFTRYSDQHGGAEEGGEWIVRRMSEGTHTLEMRYRAAGGVATCATYFRNRHVYAMVLG